MLHVSNVTQAHCVNSGSFESVRVFSAKHVEVGKRVRFGLHELDLNRKVVTGIGLTKSGRSISYKHHLLKALVAPDVPVARTTEKVDSYRFWTENGGQLKILVKKRSNKYIVCVEIVSLHPSEKVGELLMSWGLFRSDSRSFMTLDVSKQSTTETPFVKDSAGKLAVELDIDASLPPIYFSTLLKSQEGSNGEVLNIRSSRKTNFVVPVGFGSGHPFPVGLSFLDDGSINFSFFARNVEGVVLCLYEGNNGKDPSLEIDLDPYVNRSGDVWHVVLDGSVPLVSYGYRCKDSNGNKGNQVLLDPYAKVIEDFRLALPQKFLGKLCQEPSFDWGGDCRPSIPAEKLIVYRMDVRSFTKDKSSKLSGKIAGSFSGIAEKLHHFRDLGVNAILLEPIFPFDEQKGPYYPCHFFSPGSPNKGDSRNLAKSMKEMVKKLHASGIEVLLEVVFTHTSEVAALRQIDNASYYQDDTSLNCNYPVVSQMILESLRHWVIEYHIDGFVFINASSLTRGSMGEFLSRPPLVEAIAFDPLLSKVKIIADSWEPREMGAKDMKFPHWKRWAEMNAKFCVDVRNFLRGQGPISNLATRLCGSGDVFLPGRGPDFSFNYITRNVGFTLVDLVSFSNSDVGLSESSWNCGEEGATNKTVVLETRLKQIRNFLFILFVSLGIPVITMGDECGHSTGGLMEHADRNLDWNALRSGFGNQVTQFISFLSSLKVRRSDLLQRRTFLSEENIEWHGPQQSPPMWEDPSCKFLAVTLKADEESSTELASDSPFSYGDLFIAFNSADHSQEVTLPPSAVDATWVCLIDTSLPFPGFFTLDGVPLEAGVLTHEMKSHSCILFESRISG